jgi:hypothetical protein
VDGWERERPRWLGQANRQPQGHGNSEARDWGADHGACVRLPPVLYLLSFLLCVVVSCVPAGLLRLLLLLLWGGTAALCRPPHQAPAKAKAKAKATHTHTPYHTSAFNSSRQHTGHGGHERRQRQKQAQRRQRDGRAGQARRHSSSLGAGARASTICATG